MTFKAISEVPFSHPWSEKSIGMIASVVVGGTPSTDIPGYWGGDIAWMASGDVHKKHITEVEGRITSMGLRSSNATIVEPPAVAVALAGQGKTRGTVAKVLTQLCTNQSVALIVCQPGELHHDYLFHNLDFRYEELRARSSGGGRGGLSKGILEDTPLPVPDYIEQARIAEVLDTLDWTIRKTENVIAKQQRLQDALLLCLVAPTAPPPKWATTTLGDVADWVSGGTPLKSFPAYWGGDVPWVSPKDMKVFSLTDAQDHLTVLGTQQGTKVVPRHSVLVVVRGMILAHTFPVCLTQREMAINQDVKAVVARPGISGEFLGYWFRAHAARLLRLVSEATHGTKKIDLDDLKKFSIILPPENEQKRIASILATEDAALRGEMAYLETLKALKTGLSSDLLTGRIRTRPH